MLDSESLGQFPNEFSDFLNKNSEFKAPPHTRASPVKGLHAQELPQGRLGQVGTPQLLHTAEVLARVLRIGQRPAAHDLPLGDLFTQRPGPKTSEERVAGHLSCVLELSCHARSILEGKRWRCNHHHHHRPEVEGVFPEFMGLVGSLRIGGHDDPRVLSWLIVTMRSFNISSTVNLASSASSSTFIYYLRNVQIPSKAHDFSKPAQAKMQKSLAAIFPSKSSTSGAIASSNPQNDQTAESQIEPRCAPQMASKLMPIHPPSQLLN